MNILYQRRSIRSYTDAQVPTEKLEEFIKAGMNAPSANNKQPWKFVIIDDRTLLDAIPGFHPHAGMLKGAAAAILVCGDEEINPERQYWIQDCAAATENILLEITQQGFGAVWLGIYPREERIEGIRRLLHIPPSIIPFSLISLGVPAEEKPPKNLFDPEKIHHNGW